MASIEGPLTGLSTIPNIEKLLTYKQAGELLGVTARTVFTLVADGELPRVRVGKRRAFIDPADLRAYIDGQKTWRPAGGES